MCVKFILDKGTSTKEESTKPNLNFFHTLLGRIYKNSTKFTIIRSNLFKFSKIHCWISLVLLRGRGQQCDQRINSTEFLNFFEYFTFIQNLIFHSVLFSIITFILQISCKWHAHRVFNRIFRVHLYNACFFPNGHTMHNRNSH